MIPMWRRALAALSLLSVAGAALAIDYRSVSVPAAILYDAPSQAGKKLYLIKAQTPVEVVVRLEGWCKVRDAEIRQSDKPEAPVLAELDKWVAVEFIEPASPGWAKVRHRDGATGYIRATQVWGL